MFVVYDPSYFEISGIKMKEIMEILKPGDVVLRGYNGYLDSAFIEGDYSHAGIYIGNDKIVHAIAPNVERIHVIEFIECDRVAICRPKKYKMKAVKIAKDFESKKIPYDFSFRKDKNALYCFELAASCYPTFDIPTYEGKLFFGLFRKKNIYYAKSFKESPDFETVFEFNPKRNVSYCKQKQ